MRNFKEFDISRLPVGNASDKITDGCLVIEGGGFRGVYSGGVLDALMEADINMRCTIGVSSGALNGANYVSGQIGRSSRINLRFRHDKRYVGLHAMKNNNGIIGFSFLFEDVNAFEEFDYERFNKTPQRFIAVATNLLTGEAEYFEKGKCENIFHAVMASASMPYVSKPVNINNVPYLDGGCVCRIPYQWALDNKFDKIIVIKNRANDHRFTIYKKLYQTMEYTYRDYPEFAKALTVADEQYNKHCDELEKLEIEGKILILSPSENIRIDTLETNIEKLEDWYFLGYNDTKARLQEVKDYLKGDEGSQ